MNKALSCYREFSRAYIDDIATFSKNWEEHLLHLDIILTKLSELNFTVNLKKCAFEKTQIKYLGHIIGSGKHEPDPEKTAVIKNLTVPKTKKELRSVLGLCNYYREYIPKYSELVHPLTELIKKRVPDSIPWTEKHDSSFHLLKKALVEAPSLYSPVPDKPYTIHSDASQIGIAACLSQKCGDKCYPIAYASQKLSKTQQSWSTIEREAFAIMWSLKKFEAWVFGTEIEFYTDHNPLPYLTKSAPQSARLQRWAFALQKFNVTIKHCPEGLRTKEIFFEKVKITALIDSGSTVSLLRKNTSRRIMDPTKLSKNKMLLPGGNLQEELDLCHVENRQIKKELEKLIQDYKPEKTLSTDVTMRIILKDEEPVCQPPRRLAFTERQEVNKQIEEWLNEGIIRPSSAEYASPIVMVKKKDVSSRMCIDYRKLNQKLVKDKFPLPLIEDVLDTLQKAKLLDIMIVQFRNEKVSNHGSIPITIDCNVVAFIVFEEGFHQPIKRTKHISEDYKKKDLITRIARWALQLKEFDYEIERRAGSRMKHVDALSRYPVMMVCNDTLTSKLKKAQEEDENIQTLKSLLEKQESEELFEKTESIPLSTYHVDFIGRLPSRNKSYQHIFTVVDAFTKFTWLYPVKTVSAENALEKRKQQQKTFGNPIRIIPDRGSAFTSKLFNDYCDEENIQHLQIATGVPRGNGQNERIHRTDSSSHQAIIR
ncbi:retrovirus-related Pol polyprotein from transposon 17.6 [Trichonephila clavipes]|nr:retrovirus-related Pol polyprotein from transposon 17.6 [Trichonephila clavipes]